MNPGICAMVAASISSSRPYFVRSNSTREGRAAFALLAGCIVEKYQKAIDPSIHSSDSTRQHCAHRATAAESRENWTCATRSFRASLSCFPASRSLVKAWTAIVPPCFVAIRSSPGVYDTAPVRSINGVRFTFATGGPIRSTPAVVGGVLYFGSSDGNFYALDAKSGRERWRFRTGGAVTSSPAIAEGIVYFASRDGFLYAVDARNGRQRWRFRWARIWATRITGTTTFRRRSSCIGPCTSAVGMAWSARSIHAAGRCAGPSMLRPRSRHAGRQRGQRDRCHDERPCIRRQRQGRYAALEVRDARAP